MTSIISKAALRHETEGPVPMLHGPGPDGSFVHIPSGIRFPGWIGSYCAGDPRRYDSVGTDVSLRYVRKTAAFAWATVFVFPLGDSAHFLRRQEEAEADLFRLLGRSTVVARRRFQGRVPPGRAYQGLGLCADGVQSIEGNPRNVRTWLLTVDTGSWALKLRTTAALAHRHEGQKLDEQIQCEWMLANMSSAQIG
jgi:hypothetical protein